MDQPEPITIGIVTLSDRASRGEYEDVSGPAIREYCARNIRNPGEFVYRLIPDEGPLLRETLIELCDDHGCSLVLTTGGTGPTVRDITPEATVDVCRITLPGFGEQMRRISVRQVPTAILSRQTAGIRGNSLIVNLPGNPKAISVCLDSVIGAVPGAVHLSGGPHLQLY
ncbi:molybdopterin adenylyltransferase [Natronogracilivirga saccharolytica]|uniref:Molybdopterin adenylyltransferase n=1 Tax=Natronogracilivirga saccharolytica TaxID=2812953 RepID=A0A8J7RKB3_9BACT|nr:molybdopterin adenylyltransferase [Natronogracilivirga saccharolytica]MBP3193300.1 molybdopterin adenylyltransferase [Natronogracilivirga saccharolytica]